VRVVVDTNVLISALLANGKPRRLVALLMDTGQLVSSAQMLAELADVASREKFGVRQSRLASFLSILSRGAILASVKRAKRIVVEDPEDDVVLATALAGGASYVVSGDRHLLDLGRFESVRIVTVEEMLRILSR
jgi:uncharacterized protein